MTIQTETNETESYTKVSGFGHTMCNVYTSSSPKKIQYLFFFFAGVFNLKSTSKMTNWND